MVLRVNKAQKEERERVAQSLLRATLELAATHGFSGLGLREVARAAGIAPTSFYRHFPDMEALGLSLIEDLGKSLIQQSIDRAKPAKADPDRATVRLAREWLASAKADPELMRFLVAERVGSLEPLRGAIERAFSDLTAALRTAVGTDLSIADDVVPDHIVAAIRAIILDACADLLHLGLDHQSMVGDRTEKQVQIFLRGAERSNKS